MVYRKLAAQCDYALHLGLTEAGLGSKGIVATTAALSVLLQEGIGDTIRASLTPLPNGDRTEEVIVSQQILQVLGLRAFTPQVTACPGCGRTTSTFFQDMADQIQNYLRDQMPNWKERYAGVEEMKVAVMGCVVNGPGESKHSHIGISLPGTFEEPVAPVYIDGKLSTHSARRPHRRRIYRNSEQLRRSPLRRARRRDHNGVNSSLKRDASPNRTDFRPPFDLLRRPRARFRMRHIQGSERRQRPASHHSRRIVSHRQACRSRRDRM